MANVTKKAVWAMALAVMTAVPGTILAQNSQTPTLPGGARQTGNDDREEVLETIGEAVEAAVTKGGFDDLVERLVDADRNRFGEAAEFEMRTLDGRIQQIQNAWERKFGGDFEIDTDTTFGPTSAGIPGTIRVVFGEIENASEFARNWPVAATTGGTVSGGSVSTDWNYDYYTSDYDPEYVYMTDGYYNYPYSNYNYYTSDWYDETDWDWWDNEPYGQGVRNDADNNIEEGREIAVVRLSGAFGLPAVTVSMLDEAGGWKIDIPDNLSAMQVRSKLLDHLTWLGENSDNWPANERQAYRLFTHHVMMALNGDEVPAYSNDSSGR